MSLWSRITNSFRGDRLSREVDEELQSHIEEAIARGRDPAEARREFGPLLSTRERSRDFRAIAWLDSLRADAVYGWRQLMKRKVTSAAAILSLALAMGASIAAFRLIDALLLRPLPVAAPQQLYALARQGIGFTGKAQTFDGWAYPDFQLMRAAAKGEADLIAISYAQRSDLTYRSEQEMEKAWVQYVSGSMFQSFGLRPALGRLFSENDDQEPGAHPYAVLSYDYWSRRFARDPKVIGRPFRMGDSIFEIVGVGPAPFTGTETGTVTDIFLPTMMHPAATRDDSTWHRTLARIQPGVGLEPLRARLDAISRAFERKRLGNIPLTNLSKGMNRQALERFLNQRLILQPAAAGVSGLQEDYRVALTALGVLVALVLLIACANVANLMAAQGESRAREMALRVSIGAGRGRLVQLVLVESAWLAFLSALAGGLFAWWSAPFVVSRINPADNPARLSLLADWRVLGFGVALIVIVTLLFGLMPALRASAVKPARTLKGGENPGSRGRFMHALIALQVAFCFLALFVAGLFVTTLQRLSHRPLGFSPDRLLTVETVAPHNEPATAWDQMAEHLRTMPGVETAALAQMPLLSGDSWNGFVSVNGAPPGPILAYFMRVSPGWFDVMKMPILEGADFRASDTTPGVAVVNETFVKDFLGGSRALGQTFAKGTQSFKVIGVVRDAPYRNIREGVLPAAFVPFHSVDGQGALSSVSDATFVIRTENANLVAMASMLRREIPRWRSEFRVRNIRPQSELVEAQSVRERLTAMVALFVALVALALAGIGLYGVLDYSVAARRREIGIRIAIGAQSGDIARGVTAEVFAMVAVGALAGLGLGMAVGRYVEALLYQVKATDPSMLAAPSLAILAVALTAALPAVVHAVRTDPAAMLRAD